jgi:predicted PurR-regulated permease PerM
VITVAPAENFLWRVGWPGWVRTAALLVLVYAILIAIAVGIILSVARLATQLPRYASQSDALVGSLLQHLAAVGVGPEQLKQAASSLSLGKLAPVLGALLTSIAGLATNFVFLVALLLFLSIETSGAAHRLASIEVDRPGVTEALAHFAWGTRQYLLVTTVFGLIVAALETIALAVLHIPLAITWGLLSCLTNYIPYVGFIIGVAPPAVLGLLIGGPKLPVIVIAVYCLLNFIVISVTQPRFVADAVGLSITVTFLALVFWAWLLGPLGAILAIPLTLLVKALLVDLDPRAGWADALLRSSAKEPSSVAHGPTTPKCKSPRAHVRVR